MCEFCLKHGEGKKWYLQVSNYSDDLLRDVRRRRFIETFWPGGQPLIRLDCPACFHQLNLR